jgi:hypothetical protein
LRSISDRQSTSESREPANAKRVVAKFPLP